MRCVDEPAAADVDPDVAEPVEEDEVARRRRRDRIRRVPLGHGVVRERDPELGVDVHHEAGAVEAGRARAAPGVRDAEILEGDRGRLRMARSGAPGRHVHWRRRDDRGSGRRMRTRLGGPLRRSACRKLGPQPRLRGSPRGPLARRLLRLELRDRRVDRREQLPLPRKLRRHLVQLRLLLPHRLRAGLLELLQLPLPRLHRALEGERLPAERRVLVRERLRRLGAVDDLREAVRAGEHVDGARRPVHVEGVEACHEPFLRGMEIDPGDVQPILVLAAGPVRRARAAASRSTA